jgi:hypothetical protein
MIEERDANPTADTPGRFRGRRAPTALTAGGTESSEVVARLSGTESSNPLPSSRESERNGRRVGRVATSVPHRSGPRRSKTERPYRRLRQRHAVGRARWNVSAGSHVVTDINSANADALPQPRGARGTVMPT